jgi:uncharacterized protein (DUF2344 family)
MASHTEFYFEDGDYFDSLIPALKEKARRVVHEKQLTNTEELLDRARFFLSQHYNIPMKSKVFDDYTPEDLYYEYFIIEETKKTEKEINQTTEQKDQETVETINDNRNDLKSLFDDFSKTKNQEQEEAPQEDNLFSEE